LYAHNHGIRPDETALVVGLTVDDVEQIFRDIEAKRQRRGICMSSLALSSPWRRAAHQQVVWT
jgi:hypothetical protein